MKAIKACLLALLLCWSAVALADVAVPALTGRVVDQTATLSQGEQASLDSTLRDFESRKGSQIVVLIVPTTAPEAIAQYSIRVAEAWKIGRKKVDDGAILLVAKDDRKLRIEVGYGLEGALTDLAAVRIIDEEMKPRFRNNDFAGGLNAAVDRVIGLSMANAARALAQWRQPFERWRRLRLGEPCDLPVRGRLRRRADRSRDPGQDAGLGRHGRRHRGGRLLPHDQRGHRGGRRSCRAAGVAVLFARRLRHRAPQHRRRRRLEQWQLGGLEQRWQQQ
jgi:hypothetical protein